MASKRAATPAETAPGSSGVGPVTLERFWRGLSARQREELTALTGNVESASKRGPARPARRSGAGCDQAGHRTADTASRAGAASTPVTGKARGSAVQAEAEGPRAGREALREAFEGAMAQISQEKLVKLIDSLVERGSAPGLRLFAQIAGIDLSAEPAPETTAGTQVIIVGAHPAESARTAGADGTEKTGDAH